MGAMSLRWPLRRLYQEPGVLPHPTLDLGRRYQHELTARHDLHEQLHPPLECADAHPERRGRLLAPQRVALYLLHRPPRGRPTPARPSRACVGRLATRKWPGRRRAARRLCGAAPYARRPAPVGWVRARPPRVTGLARSQRRRVGGTRVRPAVCRSTPARPASGDRPGGGSVRLSRRCARLVAWSAAAPARLRLRARAGRRGFGRARQSWRVTRSCGPLSVGLARVCAQPRVAVVRGPTRWRRCIALGRWGGRRERYGEARTRSETSLRVG